MKVILTQNGETIKEFPYVTKVIVNPNPKTTEVYFDDLMMPVRNPELTNEQIIIEEE